MTRHIRSLIQRYAPPTTVVDRIRWYSPATVTDGAAA
jgi:hypothetical protein